jgi:Ca2+-dependent lipid-binding protein
MNTHPTLVFSIYHDMQRSYLTVLLRQAFNLPMRRKNKPMDSYVSLHLQQEVQQSRVVKNDLNPVFEERLEFTGQPSLQILKKQVLIFKVFSYNK